MMKSVALFTLALLGGLAGGFFLPKRGPGDDAKETAGAKRLAVVATAVAAAPFEILEKHAADSIEELIAEEGSSRLLRMTLWLIEASSDDIGELWQTLDEQDAIDHKTKDLIMIHWVERDPRAALAGAKKFGRESVAWWAWGRADPERALAAALREAPEHADSVMRSIGQFHIDLAMQLMEKHPEAVGWTSVEGIGSALAKEDPQRAVEFLRTRGHSAGDELKRWVERDPEAAVAWVGKNMTGASSYDLDRFAEELAIEHPERVAGWLDTLPSGMLRRSLAREHLRHLCDRDMTAALAFARGQEGLGTKRELMSLVGVRLASENPAASIALFREARSLPNDDAQTRNLSSNVTGANFINAWTDTLVQTNPDGLVRMAAESPNEGDQAYLHGVMKKWMRWSEVAFAEWLIDHEPGPLREEGIAELSKHLIAQTNTIYNKPPDFESSLYWASALADPTSRSHLMEHTIRTWVQRDSDGAAEYFEAAAADAAGRELYERHRRR